MRTQILVILTFSIFGMTACESLAQLSVVWERQVGDNGIGFFRSLEQLYNNDIVASAGGPPEIFQYRLADGVEIRRVQTNEILSANSLMQSNRGSLVMLTESVPYDSTEFGLFNFETGFDWRIFIQGYQYRMNKANNNRYISSGFAVFDGFADIIITEVGSDGTLLWNTIYSATNDQFGSEAIQCRTGRIAVLGQHEFESVILLFLDPEGAILDTLSFPSVNGDPVSVEGIFEEADGNLLIYGMLPLDPDSTYSFLRLSPDGDILNMAGQTGSMWEVSTVPMPDGGYLSWACPIDGPIRIRRYNASFRFLWQDTYAYVPVGWWNYGSDYAFIEPTSATGFVIGGPYHPDWDGVRSFIARLETIPTDLTIQLQPQFEPMCFDAPYTLHYGARLSNTTDGDLVSDVWIIARGPDGYPSQPVRMWEEVTVPANSSIEHVLQQFVPAGMAAGEYNYIVRVGDYPNTAVQDYFSFTVTNGPDINPSPPRDRGVVTAFLPPPERENRMEPTAFTQP